MDSVMEAIETIVEANITICKASTNDFHIDFDDKDKREKSQDFIEAMQTIRDAYPKDLRQRREAAAEYLAEKNIYNAESPSINQWLGYFDIQGAVTGPPISLSGLPSSELLVPIYVVLRRITTTNPSLTTPSRGST